MTRPFSTTSFRTRTNSGCGRAARPRPARDDRTRRRPSDHADAIKSSHCSLRGEWGRLQTRGCASTQPPRHATVQRIAASPRRCPGGDRDERRRTEASSREGAPAHGCLAAPPSSAQLLAAPLYRRRRRREVTDGRLETRGGASARLPASPRRCPAHSCLAPPSRRRQRREATDGGLESRGGIKRRRTEASSREAAPARLPKCLSGV